MSTYRGSAGIHRIGMSADACASQIMAYGYTLWQAIEIMRDALADTTYGVTEPRRFFTVGAPGRFKWADCVGWSVCSPVGPAEYSQH